jgi:hypothetical protein
MKVLTDHSITNLSNQDIDIRANLTIKTHAVIPGYDRIPADAVQGDRLILPEDLPLSPTKRLIVIVPTGEIPENDLVRRVWQLAKNASLDVLYITRISEVIQTPYHRRRLTNLTAMTSCTDFRARSTVISAKNWVEAVKQILESGDVVVVLSNHMIFDHLLWRRPLGQQLARLIGAPVYMLSGLKVGASQEACRAMKEIQAWAISLALLVAFFGMQVGIERSATKPLSTILVCLSVLAELYLLVKVNQWIG